MELGVELLKLELVFFIILDAVFVLARESFQLLVHFSNLVAELCLVHGHGLLIEIDVVSLYLRDKVVHACVHLE